MVADIQELIDQGDWVGLNELLATQPVHEIADDLSRLEPLQRAKAFRLLSKGRALRVFESMEPQEQVSLLSSLRDSTVRNLFQDMDPDDRVRLLDELPATLAKDLLSGLPPGERRLTSILLGYPEETVGRIMSPEVLSLRESMTVEEAMAKVRRKGRDAETVYTLPVTDDTRRLVGVVSLRQLVLSDPELLIGDLMSTEVLFAGVEEDQESAARRLQEAGLLALPVTDREDRLVGVYTVDDAMEVLQEEVTEDIARAGGAEPLNVSYLSASVVHLARTRAPWLLVLILTAAVSVKVLEYFEDTLAAVVTLALFIPLLIGTGGNVGAQSSTMVVRAMALDQVRFRDFLTVLFREAGVGIVLGLMLGAIALLPVSLFFGGRIALVLSLSMLSICAFGALSGAALPLLAKRFGIDPAVASAPIITTLVDAIGLVIYFLIARAVLGI
jgi:magnesium transporter